MICKNLLQGEKTILLCFLKFCSFSCFRTNIIVIDCLFLSCFRYYFPSFCGASQQAERETDQHKSTVAPLKLKGGENHWGMISGTSCKSLGRPSECVRSRVNVLSECVPCQGPQYLRFMRNCQSSSGP